MTAIYQRLPFLHIPENPSYASDYSSHYVSRQSSLLAEGFNVYNSNYSTDGCKGQRLPPVNRFHGFGRGSGPPVWAYGTQELTPQAVQLLFDGNLPKLYGKSWAWNKFIGQLPAVKKGVDEENIERIRKEVELWYHKDWKKCQEDGRRTDKRILQARWRQRHTYEAVSSKLGERRKKAEDILLKRAGTMERGKLAYLDKMTKISQKCQQNRKNIQNISKKDPKVQQHVQKEGQTKEETKSKNCQHIQDVKNSVKKQNVSVDAPKTMDESGEITQSQLEGWNDKVSCDIISLDQINPELSETPITDNIFKLTNSDETLAKPAESILSQDTSSE